MSVVHQQGTPLLTCQYALIPLWVMSGCKCTMYICICRNQYLTYPKPTSGLLYLPLLCVPRRAWHQSSLLHTLLYISGTSTTAYANKEESKPDGRCLVQLLANGVTTYDNPLFQPHSSYKSSGLDLELPLAFVRPCFNLTATVDTSVAVALVDPSAAFAQVLTLLRCGLRLPLPKH